jgi:hypothetical protein
MALLPRVTFSSAFNYADVTAPELVSAEVLVDGLTFEIVFSEAVTIGAGGNGGFTIDTDGAAVTLAYASGDGTTTLVYTLSREIEAAETFSDFDYTQPGDGVTDLVGLELATFTNQHGVVTNSSAVSGISYLFRETFEGSEVDSQSISGYDNTGWTSSSASINPNNATSPAPLAGSSSLLLGNTSRTLLRSITATDTVSVRFKWTSPASWTDAVYSALPYIQNADGSAVLVRFESEATSPTVRSFKVYGGSTGPVSSTSVALNTLHYVIIEYEKGTGSNSKARLYIDTDIATKTLRAEVTNGDATAQAGRVVLRTFSDSNIDDVDCSASMLPAYGA